MERITSTGIFANSLNRRKIYSKNGGVFYRMRFSGGFTSESDLEDRQYQFNPDDWFMPNGVHIELNGNKYYFGMLVSTYDNGEDYPAGMGGEVVLINPDESNWMTEPTVTDMQKTTDLITLLFDNDLLTYRNLFLAAEKVSKIVDGELPEYTTLNEFDKLLYNNKSKILAKLDASLIQSIFDCNLMIFQLNSQFEIGNVGIKNRQYTILPEYKAQNRLLNIFRSYIYPQLLSKPFAEWIQVERPIIYAIDFDPNYVNIIRQVFSRYVDMSNDNLDLSRQILKRLDIVVTDKPIVVSDPGTNDSDPDTETPEDDQPPKEQPATEAKENSGGTLVKLLSFGYLISKFIR